MTTHTNSLGQPIGAPLPDWTPAAPPPRTPIDGHWCRVEILDANRHARQLFDAYAADQSGRHWTYLPFGPFADFAAFRDHCVATTSGDDPLYHAILDRTTGAALGVAGYMDIQPAAGSIEVGGIHYAPALQQTPAGTEAMYLLMRRVFDDLGYRRYEWRCNSLNEPSRNAAQRLGFTYEARFRQAAPYKTRNRDTDYFSILDSEWPRIKAAFEAWLDPENFDPGGRQRRSLGIMK
jgi:RimJ/RimL family protein N-acetyltransferase